MVYAWVTWAAWLLIMMLKATMYSWSIATSVLQVIKQETHGQDANKVWGKAKCFINIDAMH